MSKEGIRRPRRDITALRRVVFVMKGGTEPRWSRSGKELFYVARNKLMSVPVEIKPTRFRAGLPTQLFQSAFVEGLPYKNRYVVSADGQRFVVVAPTEEQVRAPITVVLNWTAALRR